MASLSPLDFVPAQAMTREWLLSNGLGGYSSSTIIGMNSRKYHGLLVAPLNGFHNRHIMLSKLEETVRLGDRSFSLSTNEYPGAYHPDGFSRQVGFSFTTHPAFTYQLGDVTLEKSVRMLHGKNTALVSYRLASGKETELLIRPLLAPRPIHFDPTPSQKQFQVEPDRSGFEISQPRGMRVSCPFGKFYPLPLQYHNMLYSLERSRGYAFTETLFSPGEFSARLARNEEFHLCASMEFLTPSESLEILDRQSLRLRHIAEGFCRETGLERTDFSDSLLIAAGSFPLSGSSGKGIIAGFPWFSDWTRDAMISLPGLLLATGRHALAREVLLHYASQMQDGLLPNFIDENGKPQYTSADASLWFANAVRHLADCSGDYQFIQSSLWKPLRSFLSSYMQGNPLAEMGSDGLLRVRDPAATWMDAKINGEAVVRRNGKPVEINALWHSTLRFMAGLASRFGDVKTESVCLRAAENAHSSFQNFLSPEGGLFDTLEPNDGSFRCNQIFAISLPHSPLNHLQQRHLFNLVRSRLYTPLGLRTLSPTDPHYHDTYRGSQRERDEAYHQGAIWPWLLGAFYDAQLRVYPGSEAQVLSALKPFAEAMKQGCVGTIPELYEPSTLSPAGAPSQAWSVAEILRIYAKVKSPHAPVASASGIRQFAESRA